MNKYCSHIALKVVSLKKKKKTYSLIDCFGFFPTFGKLKTYIAWGSL